MNRYQFPTAQGEIWLWGEAEAFGTTIKPVVLVITGAFATAASPFFNLQPNLPDASVMIGHIPGNLSPPLRETSITAFAAAYSEVIKRFRKPVIVLAESAGALVALAIRAPNVRGLVLLEPPLVTANLWSLIDTFRLLLKTPENRPFIENVFGYGDETIEGRDYRYLIEELKTPTYLFMGSIPLGGRRALEKDPSLIDEPEREVLSKHPWIRTVVVKGAGHNLVIGADQKIVDVTRDLLTNYAK